MSDERMKYPGKYFLIGIVSNLIGYFFLTIPALILLILGIFGVPYCLWIGIGLSVLAWGAAFIEQIRIAHAFETSSNSAFRLAMEEMMKDHGSASKRREEARIRYPNLTSEELAALGAGEIVEAAIYRIDHRYELPMYGGEVSDRMSPVERTIYAIHLFDLEFENGGLCQFFANSSRCAAPYLAEALEDIGMAQAAELYRTFLSTHGIDPGDLSHFACETTSEYVSRVALHPFEDFDSPMQRLRDQEDLPGRLEGFIREHAQEI